MLVNSTDIFSNLLCVAFSAFDEFPVTQKASSIPYKFIGLDTTDSNLNNRVKKLEQQFVKA